MIHPVPKPRVVKKARQPLRATKPMKRYNAKRKGHLFPKGVDEARRDYVRGFPCLACVKSFAEQRTPTLACHVKSRGSSGVDAGNMYPACEFHHMQQHFLGIQGFERRYKLNLKNVAENIELAYQAGATPTQENCEGD